MFRHPFLVDNNKECTLCGNCIKNCRLRSIQLNLRLAPQELWSIETPRAGDSFLVVALGAVFFFLSRHSQFHDLIDSFQLPFPLNGLSQPAVVGSLFFWGLIALFWGVYSLVSWTQAKLHGGDFQRTYAGLGYGLIPVVLGGFLAVYVKMFITGAWRLIPNFLKIFGIDTSWKEIHLLSAQGTVTLQYIIILGGLLASLYAMYRIVNRLQPGKSGMNKIILPFLFTVVIGIIYLKYI